MHALENGDDVFGDNAVRLHHRVRNGIGEKFAERRLGVDEPEWRAPPRLGEYVIRGLRSPSAQTAEVPSHTIQPSKAVASIVVDSRSEPRRRRALSLNPNFGTRDFCGGPHAFPLSSPPHYRGLDSVQQR
jgi:hypothetical protein